MNHVLILSLLLIACIGAPPSTPPAGPAVPVEQKPKQDVYLFNDSLKEVRFFVSTHMHMTNGVQCEVNAIVSKRKGATENIQDLQLTDVACPCPDADGRFSAVEFMDFDFDGRKDIRIRKAGSDPSHPSHRYWLWSEVQQGYASSRMLDSIQDPQFDNDRQMVSSQWYARPGYRGGSTYRYQHGQLTMVSNMEKYTEGDHERWVIWGWKDGRLQPKEERQMPLPKR